MIIKNHNKIKLNVTQMIGTLKCIINIVFFEPLHVVELLLAHDKANTFCNRLVTSNF